jgi:hypothetical protein
MDGQDGQDGSNCSVADNGDGTYTLTCTDGTVVTFSDGADGSDACTASYNGDGTATLLCPDELPLLVETQIEGIELGVLSFTVDVNPNGLVTLTTVVKNFGTADAGTGWVDHFFHRDTAPIPGEFGDQFESFPSLAAGETVTVVHSQTMAPGTYSAWVAIDVNDDVYMANNVRGPVVYTVD